MNYFNILESNKKDIVGYAYEVSVGEIDVFAVLNIDNKFRYIFLEYFEFNSTKKLNKIVSKLQEMGIKNKDYYFYEELNLNILKKRKS